MHLRVKLILLVVIVRVLLRWPSGLCLMGSLDPIQSRRLYSGLAFRWIHGQLSCCKMHACGCIIVELNIRIE